MSRSILRTISVPALLALTALLANGQTQVQGAAAQGAPQRGNPVLMGGTDGSIHGVLTDSSGRLIVISTPGPGTTCPTGTSACAIQGAGAAGAAVVGNPALIGGSDGANARTILTDTSGRVVVSVTPTVTSLTYTPLADITGAASTTQVSASATALVFITCIADKSNAAAIRFGDSATTISQGTPILPGASFTVPAPAGSSYLLNAFYVYAGTGDKAYVSYGH